MRAIHCALLLLGIGALLNGCGSGVSGNSTPGSSVAKSASCFASSHVGGCHQSSPSPGTGALIVSEWQKSVHYASNVAGCIDCHETDSNHFCATCHGGTSSQPVKNPDAAGKCYKCHDDFTSAGAGKLALDLRHVSGTKFAVMTSGVLVNHLDSAGYAVLRGTQYASKCNWCHNPHNNNLTPQHREWAESGHGDPSAAPFEYYDFKTRGTVGSTTATSTATDCVRCHTATGYINYVTSNFTDISPWGAYRNSDGTLKIDPASKSYVPISNQKQVLYCNVCHDLKNNNLVNGSAYAYARRKVPQVTAYYNYSVNVQGTKIRLNATKETQYPGIVARFDNLETSNMCMVCHVGKESGDTLQALGAELAAISSTATDTLFKNVSFINSHYLTAGATIFRKSGYEFAGRTYDDDPAYKHKSIGTANSFGTGNDGPCVTCHVKEGAPSASRHSFLPIERGSNGGTPLEQSITKILSPYCANCHSSGSGSNFDGTAASLDGVKDHYRATLEVLKTAFIQFRSMYFAEAHPYFFATPYDPNYVESSATVHCSRNVAVKNWLTGAGAYTWNATKKSCTTPTNGTATTGEMNMGAAFNFNVLYHDYGAFAHNSRYVKRLLYDSLDAIDDGALNYSVRQTLNAWYAAPPAPLEQAQVKEAMDYFLVGGNQGGTGISGLADRY